MAWSTRQLAELAGTSVRAVRHYHEVGLLAVPERQANGYKRYGVAHLVRVLRIRRLTDLGFSLPQIAEMGDADELPEEALRTLDAEMAETVERLQRVRHELDVILRQQSPTDLPPELADAAAGADLTDTGRTFVVVMARVLGPSAQEAYAEVLRASTAYPADHDFDGLPADADEQTRHDLAVNLAVHVRDLLDGQPALLGPSTLAPDTAGLAARAIGVAMDDLFNPAQRDVIARVGHLLRTTSPSPGRPSSA